MKAQQTLVKTLAATLIIGFTLAASAVQAAPGNEWRQDNRQDGRQVNRVIDRNTPNVNVRRIGTPVVKHPRYHKPVVVVGGFHRPAWYAHPLITAVGIAIIIDATGNTKTESGQEVIVVGEGDKVLNVYESANNQVIIIKG